MWGHLAVGVVFLLVTYVAQRWRRVRNYWAQRGVLHDPPHPIMGSLTFLQKRNFVEWMIEKYMKFKPAPYFGMWLFWRPTLVVTSPELARRVLVSDADVFRNRLVDCGKSDPIGRLNMFVVDDPLWTVVRKKTTSMFTSAKLKTHHMLQSKKAQELVQRFRKETALKNFINLRDVLACYSTDVIGAAAFGIAGDATLTGESPMRVITKQFMDFDFWRGINWTSIFFFPELTNIFGFTFFPKDAIKYFRKVYSKIYEERSKENFEKERDLMDSLIKMKKETMANGDGLHLCICTDTITDDVLIAQAAIFLEAGFDTTAMSMSFLLYELAYNPDVQQKLYEELAATKREKGFTSESLQEMVYLNACLKENLRKYSGMSWLNRVALRDYKVDDKLTIPKGFNVYVAAGGFHYDPDYFPDPLTFNPDRFLPENEANIKPYTYIPFGEGPRQCIGLRFALQSMRYAISHVILGFELRPVPGMPHPRDVKADKIGLLHAPDIPLTVQFVSRES